MEQHKTTKQNNKHIKSKQIEIWKNKKNKTSAQSNKKQTNKTNTWKNKQNNKNKTIKI